MAVSKNQEPTDKELTEASKPKIGNRLHLGALCERLDALIISCRRRH